MTSVLTRELRLENGRTEESRRPDRRLLEGYLHKTSNTLCGIKGYASLIADREYAGPEAGQWARKIIAEVERMEEIFRSVGDLTRGRGNPDTGVDLRRLVTDVARGFGAAHPEIDVRLSAVPAGEIRLPAADLSLMLTAVLDNCAESADPGGRPLTVEVAGRTMPDGRVFLDIRDNGCGMDGDLAVQAACPFVTTKDGHHGVGLTRVDTLLDMYGLVWNLASEEGRGTRVQMEVGEVL